MEIESPVRFKVVGFGVVFGQSKVALDNFCLDFPVSTSDSQVRVFINLFEILDAHWEMRWLRSRTRGNLAKSLNKIPLTQ